jgi:AmmeMemoRadiSam system protein A
MPGFTSLEQEQLLELAQRSVAATVHRKPLPTPQWTDLSPRLAEPGASFVTLTIGERLRGCIGTLQASIPLAEDVVLRANAAAKDDPRFPPVTEPELTQLSYEISVLSTPLPLAYGDAQDLLGRLHPGVDGVILVYGFQRATFLPQVWERVPDPSQFLGMLCRKAGLPTDAWRTLPLEISTYQVESFHREAAA